MDSSLQNPKKRKSEVENGVETVDILSQSRALPLKKKRRAKVKAGNEAFGAECQKNAFVLHYPHSMRRSRPFGDRIGVLSIDLGVSHFAWHYQVRSIDQGLKGWWPTDLETEVTFLHPGKPGFVNQVKNPNSLLEDPRYLQFHEKFPDGCDSKTLSWKRVDLFDDVVSSEEGTLSSPTPRDVASSVSSTRAFGCAPSLKKIVRCESVHERMMTALLELGPLLDLVHLVVIEKQVPGKYSHSHGSRYNLERLEQDLLGRLCERLRDGINLPLIFEASPKIRKSVLGSDSKSKSAHVSWAIRRCHGDDAAGLLLSGGAAGSGLLHSNLPSKEKIKDKSQGKIPKETSSKTNDLGDTDVQAECLIRALGVPYANAATFDRLGTPDAVNQLLQSDKKPRVGSKASSLYLKPLQ